MINFKRILSTTLSHVIVVIFWYMSFFLINSGMSLYNISKVGGVVLFVCSYLVICVLCDWVRNRALKEH